jgi:cation diffusion facilitator family transporter
MMLKQILDWFGFGSGPTNSAHRGHGSHSAHGENDGAGHGHSHGVIDATIATTTEGISALKWSFVILAATALMQLVVVYYSGSVALLADTIHNLGDATTAIPLWIAFVLVRRPATKIFNYGLGRVEDLAGIVIVLIILASAIVAGYESIDHLINPRPVSNLGWLVAAGIVGFAGNEIVAVLRIRTGRRINSAALIADGYHARTDGLTSLAVVVGAVGVWAGFPLADPIIGLLITIAIFGIVWQSARSVLTRMLDGVEPGLLDEVRHAAEHVEGVERLTGAKARWIGHKLHVQLTVMLDDRVMLATAHVIAARLRDELFSHLPALAEATILFAPPEIAADDHHAPEAVPVVSRLATGLLQIVDTPDGERMRLRVSRHAEGLNASVDIQREGGRTEVLALRPVGGDHHWLESAVAPEEPHEFAAKLRLATSNDNDEVPFSMAEPAGHKH